MTTRRRPSTAMLGLALSCVALVWGIAVRAPAGVGLGAAGALFSLVPITAQRRSRAVNHELASNTSAVPGFDANEAERLFLLPWESRFVRRGLKVRDRVPEKFKVSQRNYGPVGYALLLAAYADMLSMMLIGSLSMIAAIAWDAGRYAFLLVAAVLVLAFTRLWQCSRAGKKWRAGRPYERMNAKGPFG